MIVLEMVSIHPSLFFPFEFGLQKAEYENPGLEDILGAALQGLPPLIGVSDII